MKEIKKFLPFIALFMAAAAFVLSFFATLQIVQYGVHAEFKNIIWGCKQVTIEGTVRTIKETFGFESSGIAPLPFIGLMMMLVGAIASVILTLFVKNKFTKWIVLGCSALILAGGIMVFFAPSAFARNMTIKSCELHGITDKSEIQREIKKAIDDMHQQSPKAPMPIVMGVIGCLSAIAAGAGALLPEE